MNQYELQFTESYIDQFRDLLHRHGWMTRRDVCAHTGWKERTVRAVAEEMGKEVVRGQRGFKLLADIDPDREVNDVLHAGHAAISQAKRQMRYGVAMVRAAQKITSRGVAHHDH